LRNPRGVASADAETCSERVRDVCAATERPRSAKLMQHRGATTPFALGLLRRRQLVRLAQQAAGATLLGSPSLVIRHTSTIVDLCLRRSAAERDPRTPETPKAQPPFGELGRFDLRQDGGEDRTLRKPRDVRRTRAMRLVATRRRSCPAPCDRLPTVRQRRLEPGRRCVPCLARDRAPHRSRLDPDPHHRAKRSCPSVHLP
jgi:hypothetical protein